MKKLLDNTLDLLTTGILMLSPIAMFCYWLFFGY